jgi:L-amino acid N-acyltransferase YncA
MIRAVKSEDAQALAEIYNYYILNTVITFEEAPVDAPEMESRIRKVTAAYPWFVHEEGQAVLGYAYASRWGERASYRHAAAATVYLRIEAHGRGIGTGLYRALLDELKKRGLHTVLGGIALPNEKSQRLHERFGFKKVAHLSEVGFKFDRWVDVGYWQLML